MTTIEHSPEERLRQAFKQYLNPFMMTLWRLGFGSWFRIWPQFSGNVMVLTHVGRKTGRKYYQPLNFVIVEDEIYCVAAFGAQSDWYRNLCANPAVEVWLPHGWWAGVAEDITDSPDRIGLIREVLIGSGFAAYVAGLNPPKMTDEEIEAESRKYKLLRIQRHVARTGPGGPGDLAWLWQVATFLLLWLFVKKRQKS